jgi:lipoyl-dependent peroxiredoxin
MEKALFTAHASAKGGRGGHVKSDDGLLDLDLVMPTEKTDKKGTNPEQLFAAAYSSCYDGALNSVASSKNKEIDSTTSADVSFLKDPDDGGYKIAVILTIEMKGVSQKEAEKLSEEAHQVCPYSKATRGNIEVELKPKAV